jgi:hypothetical protein
MAKRGRKSSGKVQFVEARFEGAGGLQANVDRWRLMNVDDPAGDLPMALAAKGHRAIQERKAERDDFERDAAFEYFSRMPRRVLASHAARPELDRIARTIFAAPHGRRSFKETRRRIGELRKEFLRERKSFANSSASARQSAIAIAIRGRRDEFAWRRSTALFFLAAGTLRAASTFFITGEPRKSQANAALAQCAAQCASI